MILDTDAVVTMDAAFDSIAAQWREYVDGTYIFPPDGPLKSLLDDPTRLTELCVFTYPLDRHATRGITVARLGDYVVGFRLTGTPAPVDLEVVIGGRTVFQYLGVHPDTPMLFCNNQTGFPIIAMEHSETHVRVTSPANTFAGGALSFVYAYLRDEERRTMARSVNVLGVGYNRTVTVLVNELCGSVDEARLQELVVEADGQCLHHPCLVRPSRQLERVREELAHWQAMPVNLQRAIVDLVNVA